MRINKYIAGSGLTSRRKAELLIQEGRVKVNGNTIYDLGHQVDENTDLIEVDGKKISLKEEKMVYIILNKPEGYISSVKDQFGRKDIMLLVSDIKERIYPVGRLDYETSGLLLMTNDGDLTYKLTHPKHEFEKVYIASIKGIPNKEELESFRNGLVIDNYTTSKAKISILKSDNKKNYSVCKVSIHEGRNRQVRKMFFAIGHPVMNLKRVGLGRININNLEPGKYRHLSQEELAYLKKF
nr:pseudouridine synthase [uncultured Peptostreptococcus sp.]